MPAVALAPAAAPPADPSPPPACMSHDRSGGYSEQLIAAKAEVAETRQALVVTEKRVSFAEAVIEEVKPKVDAFHAFLSDDGLCNLRTAARAYDAPSQLFVDWLKDRGYVFREKGDLQPSAGMRRDGYMKLRAGPDAVGKLRNQAMVTRSGLFWLRQRWHVGPGRVLALQAAQAQRQGRLDI
ncbi:phage antirepressor KilAC domain-containing protein [Methylobacterium indicum]|uniref:phage antirepressor KilAC domain-containing protein n=1 Tax=Methylobacterium indicum TaxID=1775910 RepID=UPI002435D428|nr:phage antirepressor KilAC domain-containing protein [Methylobacterium indicum]